MTESELDALMGSPTDVRKQSYGVAWSWSRLDPYSGDARSVSVVLRDGIVVTSAGVPESFK